MPEPSIKLIDRTAHLLTLVGEKGVAGIRLADAVRLGDLGKTTTHRLLNALREVDFVSFDATDKRYRLGSALARLGREARKADLALLARPGMERLARETQDTVFLSVREGLEALCVAREVGAFPIKALTLDPGDLRPLGVGAGSAALLSAVEKRELEAMLPLLERSLAPFAKFDAARLRRDWELSRERGHALNEDGVVDGMSAVGVTVGERGAAALSVAAITQRMDPDRRRAIVALLKEEAAALAALLQSAGPPPRRAAGRERAA